jgi:hypothetical protein
MAKVAGGKVTFARTVQPADYESKRAECELVFEVEDGESPEDALREVGALVRRECLSLVGLRDRPIQKK